MKTPADFLIWIAASLLYLVSIRSNGMIISLLAAIGLMCLMIVLRNYLVPEIEDEVI